MYHVAVHELAQRVLATIRKQELLRAGDRAGIAVSGGADSVALLRLLLELRSDLGIVLAVVHFNHRLRASESDADEDFVATLARQYDVEFYSSGGDVRLLASRRQLSIETAARELRYEFFGQLLGSTGEAVLGKVATAHTLDDQAETVLMRMIRGAGTRGIGGIHPRIEVEGAQDELSGEIVRPLLGIRRRDLEGYLRSINQPWREDSSNRDLRHTRNRVRRNLMPLLEGEFNPAIAEGLSEFSEIARDEEDFWENEVAGWMGTVVQWVEPEWARRKSALVQIGAPGATEEFAEQIALNALLDARWFLREPVAVQRRVLRAIGEMIDVPLEFKHIENMRHFAEENTAGKHLELPLGWRFENNEESLAFVQPVPNDEARDYQYRLPIPGVVTVDEVGISIVAEEVREGASCDQSQLLNAALLPPELIVRKWRAGERYWPAHTKAAKKVKELLQDHDIKGAEKRLWPVVTNGADILWMPGFPVATRFAAIPRGAAILIRVEQRD